jgi:hypothetical protein
MRLIDANLLIYAYATSLPDHRATIVDAWDRITYQTLTSRQWRSSTGSSSAPVIGISTAFRESRRRTLYPEGAIRLSKK